MHLASIHLRNFRRLRDVQIDFEERETIFVGPNNSGKTSATAVMRSFFGKRDFKVHDFSVCVLDDVNSFHPDDSERLSEIQLDLWFAIDADDIDFGRAFALTTDLTGDFVEVGIRCSFEVRDSDELWSAYEAAFPIEKSGNRKKPLSHFLDLDGNLKRHFHIQYSSLERRENKIVAVPLEAKAGRATLYSLLRVDFVDAQRNIDDENATRSNKLSEAFATYYRRNLEQAQMAEVAVQVIEENNASLTDHYLAGFAPLMNMIAGLGLPSQNDRSMKIVSTLSSETALKGNTELFYFDERSQHELPEAYNGLGFKNLVFMAIQIDNFHRQWLATEDERPLCQMIFIEEPEVHLHAQVQQTFIGQMWRVLNDSKGEAGPIAQLTVTTHSSHILDAVDFENVRYFRRVVVKDPIAGNATRSFHCTTVRSLRQFQPVAINDGEIIVSIQEVISFLQKFLRLTHCDLFFADAAILIEGSVEKLLLPSMIDRVAPKLKSKYLATLEVGGAYSIRFTQLLSFLDIPYLVVTDLDSVDPQKNRRNCIATHPEAVSSNQSLNAFFGNANVAELSIKSIDDCTQEDGTRFVAYQKPVTVPDPVDDKTFHGRTLEEAFVYENLAIFRSNTLSIGITLPEDEGQLNRDVWKRIKSSSFKKTEFALNVLASDSAWVVPTYITEGLQWLVGVTTPINPEAD